MGTWGASTLTGLLLHRGWGEPGRGGLLPISYGGGGGKMVLEGPRASYGHKPEPPEGRAAGRVGWGPWGALAAGQWSSPLT